MNYNRKEVFRMKSTKELYDIATGKSQLDKEAEITAEMELNNRRLSLNDTTRIGNKIELESLFHEQKLENGAKRYLLHPDSIDIYYQMIAGIITTLIMLRMLFLQKSNPKILLFIILFITSLALTIYKSFSLRKKRKQELLRRERIIELIKEL